MNKARVPVFQSFSSIRNSCRQTLSCPQARIRSISTTFTLQDTPTTPFPNANSSSNVDKRLRESEVDKFLREAGNRYDRNQNVSRNSTYGNLIPPIKDHVGLTKDPEPYHFHIYSHKHNTHITVAKPNGDAILSVSCGNLGFRKAGRGTYDAGYQLGAYVLSKLQEDGKTIRDMERLKVELLLRGFGKGREAVTKAILGTEGNWIRNKISKVVDSTRLKFGGTRSPKPRRLG